MSPKPPPRTRGAARTLGVMLVAALVVLSGCNLPVGPGSSGAATTETVTPVPVPDTNRTGTPQAITYPPGMDAGGITNPYELIQAHTTVLSRQSFTLHYRGRQPNSSDVIVSFELTTRVANDSVAYAKADWPIEREQLYVDDSGAYTRDYDATADEWAASVAPAGSYGLGNPARIYATYLVDYITGESTKMTVVEQNGTTLFRTVFTAPPVRLRTENVTSYQATAYVEPDGLIRTLVVSYWVRVDGKTRRVRFRFDYRKVGTTTVDQPDWVDRLKQKSTPTLTVTTRNATATTTTPTTRTGTATYPNGL